MTGHGALNYDGNLNVSGYDGWAFAHDAEKRLLSVTGNGHSAQFAHDGLGRCVKRTIDGLTTVFTYDNWKPVAEWTGTGTAVAWNLYGAGADEILVRFQQTPEGYLHYHLDPMGNVQFLLSDHPDPGLEKYTYDVFGKPTIIGWNGDVRPISNHGNRFLFRGREYLYTFGLYDYRRRIYHPGLGRFIQTDPLGLQIEAAKLSAEQRALYFGGTAPEKFNSSELNLYRYCHNNPVNHSDPLGLYEEDVHSNLTLVLARNIGFSQASARNIAGANQGVDTNAGTGPVSGGVGARKLYHFTTEERREVMRNDALQRRSEEAFGRYLHALQDSYSHQRGQTDRDGAPYSPVSGHVHSTDPDKTHLRPELAEKMAKDTYCELRRFYQNQTGNEAPDNWQKIRCGISDYLKAKR